MRDLDTDRRAGKLTLAVRLGRPRTRNLYALLIAAAFVAVPVTLLADRRPGLGASDAARGAAGPRAPRRGDDPHRRPSLNGALAGTGALLAAFSVLLSAGLLIAA